MSNSKAFYTKRLEAQDAFILGTTDPRELATRFGVSPVTIKKWIKKGSWETQQKDEARLERKISIARRKALLTALEAYSADPQNTALQSLVSILKNEQRRAEPAKELNDYIVKFLDQTTDFLIEKGYDGLLKQLQSCLVDLAEYLRVRNA